MCVCVVFQTDLESAGLPVCDAVVNLAGENILNPLRRSEHTRTHTQTEQYTHTVHTTRILQSAHTLYRHETQHTLYTHIEAQS